MLRYVYIVGVGTAAKIIGYFVRPNTCESNTTAF